MTFTIHPAKKKCPLLSIKFHPLNKQKFTNLENLKNYGIDPIRLRCYHGSTRQMTIERVVKALQQKDYEQVTNTLHNKEHACEITVNPQLWVFIMDYIETNLFALPMELYQARRLMQQFNESFFEFVERCVTLHINECQKSRNSQKLKYLHLDQSSECPLCIRSSRLNILYLHYLRFRSIYTDTTESTAWNVIKIDGYPAFDSCTFHDNNSSLLSIKRFAQNVGTYSQLFLLNQVIRFLTDLTTILISQQKLYMAHQVLTVFIQKLVNSNEYQIDPNDESLHLRNHIHYMNQIDKKEFFTLIRQYINNLYEIGAWNRLKQLRLRMLLLRKARKTGKDYDEEYQLEDSKNLKKFIRFAEYRFNWTKPSFVLKPLGSETHHCGTLKFLESNSTSLEGLYTSCCHDYGYDEAKDVFDALFEQLHQSLELKQKVDGKFSSDKNKYNRIYELYLHYSLHLAKYRKTYATPYFDYCGELRPLNAYFHYQFSLYLYRIVKQNKQAWYHLKMALKWNSVCYQSLFDKDYCYTIDDDKDNSIEAIRYFVSFCKQMYLSYGSRAECSLSECKNDISVFKKPTNDSNSNSNSNSNKPSGKHTCRGCKCAVYCSRKCQKRHWNLKHRKECAHIASKKLSATELQTVRKLYHLLNA